MPRAYRWLFIAALFVLVPASAHASQYDLIFADSIDVVATASVSGLSYGNDIALIVNTGATNIGQSELGGATFTATSTNPLVDGVPTVLGANLGAPVTPVLPLEAMGTMLPGSPLLARVLPGETARNVFPRGIFWLSVDFPAGFQGTAVFAITMKMGIDVAHYNTVVNIQQGPVYSVTVLHAGRVSSTTSPTAARASSWGAIKRLYQ